MSAHSSTRGVSPTRNAGAPSATDELRYHTPQSHIVVAPYTVAASYKRLEARLRGRQCIHDLALLADRRDRVVLAPDHQRRAADGRKFGGQVERFALAALSLKE